jgi:hypothetical protein
MSTAHVLENPLRGYKISKACTKPSPCGKTLLKAYQYQQCAIVLLLSEVGMPKLALSQPLLITHQLQT